MAVRTTPTSQRQTFERRSNKFVGALIEDRLRSEFAEVRSEPIPERLLLCLETLQALHAEFEATTQRGRDTESGR